MKPVQLTLVAAAFVTTGCASEPAPSTVSVPPGRYTQAFEAAKDAVRQTGFELDRVDARAGVITSRERATAGFATPWTGVETTMGQAWDGLLNDLRRRIEISFVPVEAGDAAPPAPQADAAPAPDLRTLDGALVARVRVTVERVTRATLRPAPVSIRMTSNYVDPLSEQSGPRARITNPIGDDPWLAGRLATIIRLGAEAAPVQQPAPAAPEQAGPGADGASPEARPS